MFNQVNKILAFQTHICYFTLVVVFTSMYLFWLYERLCWCLLAFSFCFNHLWLKCEYRQYESIPNSGLFIFVYLSVCLCVYFFFHKPLPNSSGIIVEVTLVGVKQIENKTIAQKKYFLFVRIFRFCCYYHGLLLLFILSRSEFTS